MRLCGHYCESRLYDRCARLSVKMLPSKFAYDEHGCNCSFHQFHSLTMVVNYKNVTEGLVSIYKVVPVEQVDPLGVGLLLHEGERLEQVASGTCETHSARLVDKTRLVKAKLEN